MVLLIGGIVMLVLSHVPQYVCELVLRQNYLPPILPATYKDVFKAGSSGKKQLGTTSATCWARGGICVDIHQCPQLKIDVGIAGCAWGYKVCCLIQKPTTPIAAYKFRRSNLPVIKDMKDLGASLEIIALRNSMLLSSWQQAAENEDVPEPEEISFDELLS